MVKFIRRIWYKYSKLGKRRKKKQVWRRPKGRDNPMRERRRGYPAVVSVGYKKARKEKGKIEGKIPKVVKNLQDLETIQKNEIVILSKIGKKKKIEIMKKAKTKGIEIKNINVKKFLKKNLPKKAEIKPKENKNESK